MATNTLISDVASRSPVASTPATVWKPQEKPTPKSAPSGGDAPPLALGHKGTISNAEWCPAAGVAEWVTEFPPACGIDSSSAKAPLGLTTPSNFESEKQNKGIASG